MKKKWYFCKERVGVLVLEGNDRIIRFDRWEKLYIIIA